MYKEFKVYEIGNSEMEITNQKIVILKLGEVEYFKLPMSDVSTIMCGEAKKFILVQDSSLLPNIISRAKKNEYITLDLDKFIIRDENRNGFTEEIAYHKDIVLL